MTQDEENQVRAVRESRFAHPVLFVSHRWESEGHPDPGGQQLARLQKLRDCFIIYDYSSFPQEPRSRAEEDEFEQILAAMDGLMPATIDEAVRQSYRIDRMTWKHALDPMTSLQLAFGGHVREEDTALGRLTTRQRRTDRAHDR